MKLSVIHNLYKRNRFVPETVQLNLLALDSINTDYEYILFNDCGDKEIGNDLIDILPHKNVKYVYSLTNYGKGKCSGGWIGAIPHLTGDVVHNTGQDDVFTTAFYKKCLDEMVKDKELMLIFTNCFVSGNNLMASQTMLHPAVTQEYAHSDEIFRWWFGIGEKGVDEVTRANNNIPAPGVIYRRNLHELIGPPDLDTFLGAADFEYWARVIFNRHKIKYLNEPLWIYRKSEYSHSNVNDTLDTHIWVDKVKDKYAKLYKERKTA